MNSPISLCGSGAWLACAASNLGLTAAGLLLFAALSWASLGDRSGRGHSFLVSLMAGPRCQPCLPPLIRSQAGLQPGEIRLRPIFFGLIRKPHSPIRCANTRRCAVFVYVSYAIPSHCLRRVWISLLGRRHDAYCWEPLCQLEQAAGHPSVVAKPLGTLCHLFLSFC
jgi:hypothetical protein